MVNSIRSFDLQEVSLRKCAKLKGMILAILNQIDFDRPGEPLKYNTQHVYIPKGGTAYVEGPLTTSERIFPNIENNSKAKKISNTNHCDFCTLDCRRERRLRDETRLKLSLSIEEKDQYTSVNVVSDV